MDALPPVLKLGRVSPSAINDLMRKLMACGSLKQASRTIKANGDLAKSKKPRKKRR